MTLLAELSAVILKHTSPQPVAKVTRLQWMNIVGHTAEEKKGCRNFLVASSLSSSPPPLGGGRPTTATLSKCTNFPNDAWQIYYFQKGFFIGGEKREVEGEGQDLHALASFLRGGKKEEKKRESRVSASTAPRATFVYWANVDTGRKKCETFLGIRFFSLIFFGLKFVLLCCISLC